MSKKILVIKPDEIGDVILLIPFLKELRKQRSHHQIVLASNPKTHTLVGVFPWVDEVISYSRDFRSHTMWSKVRVSLSAVKFLLKHGCFFYDEVYLMRTIPFFPEKILTQLSFGKKRIGWLNGGWLGLYTHPLKFQSGYHEVSQLGCALPTSTSELSNCHFPCGESKIRNAKRLFPATATRIVAIGANLTIDENRNWPIASYAAFIQQLHEKDLQLHFVLLGGEGDVASNEKLIHLTGGYVQSIAGKCSLIESYAALHYCSLFVGNDSGPMHLAAAAGLPVIEISGYPIGGDVSHANAPERFGPFGVPFRVCRPSEELVAWDKNQNESRIQEVSVLNVLESYFDLCKEVGLFYG